jgi:signal transduction histidine kinase
MLEISILILSVLANSILGLAVYIKNPSKDMNKLFFYLTLSLSVWAVITYFSLHPAIMPQITWVRLVLAVAAVQDFFVLSSFAIFPEGRLTNFRFVKPAAYYLIFVILLTQTPLVFKGLDQNSQPIVAPGIIFFSTLILGFLGTAVYLLIRRFRHSAGRIRNQLRVVIFGVITCFAAIIFTNFVLVNVFKNTSLISFAPLLTLILTGSMAYAILKHKLFDLRPAIARALAYLLTFALVILVYTGLAFVLDNIFSFNSGTKSSGQSLFYIFLAVFTALAFQPVKKFFDKATNRLFFKDAYEPQVLLDNLSDILVGNIRLEDVLRQSSRLISNEMRLAGADFIVYEKGEADRVIGTFHPPKEEHNFPEPLLAEIKRYHHPVIITDNLSQSQHFLREGLAELNYAAAVRLSTRTSAVGYLLVGYKKSGDTLNPLDLRVLNIMADELAIAIENAVRFEEIQKFNITLQDKVDEATKKLRHANVRLKELDATKDEFISMASHQLRTPLTTIKGYLSMILDGDVGKVKAEEKDLIQHAFDSAERMVYLIADLLNVSRLQTGKFVIENKPTNLAQVLEGEITQLKEQAATRKIMLAYEKPKEFPLLNLDETKIRQVMMNFLDNGLYYTPSGGEVTAKLDATPDSVNFTVTDTGVGVPVSVQHHLFTKFYRADNARKMRPDGTGLGLYMAKKVIVAQGGAVIFKSTEGKGSTFGFSFPRKGMEAKA